MQQPGKLRWRLGYTRSRGFRVESETAMKSVLVVDDNELVRNLIEAVLVNAGFDVITAASGAEAIEMLHRHDDSIACVLQDMSLPDMPGEQVVAALHKIRPDLSIIILTVEDAASCEARLSGLEIAGYLQKPFDSDMLAARVGEIVEANHAQR